MEQVFASHSADSERAELNLVWPRWRTLRAREDSDVYFGEVLSGQNRRDQRVQHCDRGPGPLKEFFRCIARFDRARRGLSTEKEAQRVLRNRRQRARNQISLPAGSYVRRSPAVPRSLEWRRSLILRLMTGKSRTFPRGGSGTEAALASSETGMVETSRPKARAIRKRRLLYAIGELPRCWS